MKGIFVALIVVGSIALGAGAVIVGYNVVKKGRNSDNYVTNRHDIDEEIKNFDIRTATANVELAKANDGKGLVVCEEREKVYHQVTVQDGLLKIKTVDTRRWYEKWFFNFDFRPMKITVYLPETACENFNYDSSTGGLDIASDYTFTSIKAVASTGSININNKVSGDIEAKASTGSVSIKNATANKILAKASTGSVTVKNIEVVGEARAEASTGSVNVEGLKCASFYAKTSTGSFNGLEIEATGDAHIEGSTGSSKVKTIKAKNLEIKHSIGGATIEDAQCEDLTIRGSTGAVRLTSVIVDNKIDVKTSTGDIIFKDSDAASLKLETDTGAVRGNFLSPKIVYFDSDTGHGHFPKETSGGVCEIKTDTGDADLTW